MPMIYLRHKVVKKERLCVGIMLNKSQKRSVLFGYHRKGASRWDGASLVDLSLKERRRWGQTWLPTTRSWGVVRSVWYIGGCVDGGDIKGCYQVVVEKEKLDPKRSTEVEKKRTPVCKTGSALENHCSPGGLPEDVEPCP